MDKCFTMTVQQASWRYGLSEEDIQWHAARKTFRQNWFEQDICRQDRRGQLWLHPYNFDLWHQWMVRRVAARRKERNSRKWYLLASLLLFAMVFFVTHITQTPSVKSVLFNLGFAVLPPLIVWRCVSMEQLDVPAYVVRNTQPVMDDEWLKRLWEKEDRESWDEFFDSMGSNK